MPKIKSVFDSFPDKKDSTWTSTTEALNEGRNSETIYAESFLPKEEDVAEGTVNVPSKEDEKDSPKEPLHVKWLEEPKEEVIESNDSNDKASKAPSFSKPSMNDINTVPGPPPIPQTANYYSPSYGRVDKLEYIQGIRNISFLHKQYEEDSIIVSKPFEIDGNVMEVSLDAAESHPLFDEVGGKSTNRQTSVEYYISYVPMPTMNDWHAILPEGQKIVQSERLLFDGKRTTQLRFPVNMSATFRPVVYKNGLVIENRFWTIVGKQTLQLQDTIDPYGVYTISYTPDGDVWNLDIAQKKLIVRKQIDTFPDGTNHNKTVVLSKYPYVEYDKIRSESGYNPNTSTYRPIEVSIKQGQVAIQDGKTIKEVLPLYDESKQNAYTYNRTNYLTSEWPKLKPYSLVKGEQYKGFEYYQEGNKVILSETFHKSTIYDEDSTSHGNGAVQIAYDYLVATFRVKIILRRNTLDDVTVSPNVLNYTLKMKTMK